MVRVIPTARAARLTMDREGIRRLAAETLGLPTSPYKFCDSLAELQAALARVFDAVDPTDAQQQAYVKACFAGLDLDAAVLDQAKPYQFNNARNAFSSDPMRKAPAEQRKRAAMYPEAVIREKMGVGDDEPTVFVETERFAERVRDVGQWVKPALPWISSCRPLGRC